MILTLETDVTYIILTTYVPGVTMLFFLVISCSYDLVIILHNSYSYRTSHIHYLHVTLCMHGLHVHDLSSQLFLLLFLFLVLDTAKHIVLMFYLLLLHLHILPFTILFPLCTLTGPLLMDLYYLSVSKSESQSRGLIVEHILVLLTSAEFSFFSWLVLFRFG